MKNFSKKDYRICIVGLGYVGLPLAARFVLKGFDVIGYDSNHQRISDLQNIKDINNDISINSLKSFSKNAILTSNPIDIKDANVFIVTVPTPINNDRSPDLRPVIEASELIGSIMKKGSIVIYESTVYPGVTDDICTPVLSEKSGLTFNKDFMTGYSPERVVPGDKVNTIESIKKVISASNKKTLKEIEFLYSSIIDAGTHAAPSIKVAEASKVTENIQRDVNIALINEFHQLYSAIGIDTNDVIEAASTKWNFMKLSPGLVGGHCIGIDPYYLMHRSKMAGYAPNIMTAARNLNETMGNWVLEDFIKFSEEKNLDLKSIEITILGYTFKENCSDTRNTKVKDLIFLMIEKGMKLSLWDPFLTPEDHEELNKIGIKTHNIKPEKVELAFLCVFHNQIIKFIKGFDGIIYDYRNVHKS